MKMRSEQFVVQSAASDCTGNEAPVAQDIGTRFFFDVPAESQLLIRYSSSEASDTELGSKFFVPHAEFTLVRSAEVATIKMRYFKV